MLPNISSYNKNQKKKKEKRQIQESDMAQSRI